jgi:hypothetical protein
MARGSRSLSPRKQPALQTQCPLHELAWSYSDLIVLFLLLTIFLLLFLCQNYFPEDFLLLYQPFSQFIELMQELTFPFLSTSLQFHFTDLVGSLLVCQKYRQAIFSKHWTESLFTCCVMQYGGTTLTGILLGQPPGWMLSHSSFLSLLIAWWLTFFSPFDFYWSLIHSPNLAPILQIHHSFFSDISSIHAATSWGMDKVLFNTFHTPTILIRESIFLSLLTAVLSSNGGGLISDCLNLCHQNSFELQTPTCLKNTPQGNQYRSNLLRSFFLGLVYYLALNPLNIFPWESLTQEQRVYGHSIIGILCLLMWLRSQLLPQADVIGKVSSILLKILNISSTIAPRKEQDNEKKKTN